MTKKTFISAIAVIGLGASSSCLALQYYVGAQGGWSHFSLDKTISAKATYLPNPVFTPQPNRSTSASGLGLGAFAGLNKSFGKFNLGAELGYNHSFTNKTTSFQQNATTVTYTVKEKLSNSFNLSLLPGYKINKWNVYGRLGLSYGEFQSSSSDGGIIGTTGNYKHWQLGYLFGAGAAYKIKQFNNGSSLGMRLQYDYTVYPSFTNTSLSQGELSHIKVKYHNFHNQAIMLGLVYHF